MLGYLPYMAWHGMAWHGMAWHGNDNLPREWVLSIHVAKTSTLGIGTCQGQCYLNYFAIYIDQKINTYCHPQDVPEVIDFCSESSNQDSFENGFSPFKAITEAKPIDVLKRVIPDYCEEYHDPKTRMLPTTTNFNDWKYPSRSYTVNSGY